MASSLFLPADELMVQYARYHRDQRNIATHMIGVPMIVFGVGVLLARGHLPSGGSGPEPGLAGLGPGHPVVPEPRPPAAGAVGQPGQRRCCSPWRTWPRPARWRIG